MYRYLQAIYTLHPAGSLLWNPYIDTIQGAERRMRARASSACIQRVLSHALQFSGLILSSPRGALFHARENFNIVTQVWPLCDGQALSPSKGLLYGTQGARGRMHGKAGDAFTPIPETGGLRHAGGMTCWCDLF